MDFIEDVEDGPLFWFALADVQWKYGRLLSEVKEKALKYIASGDDLERWKENKKQYEKRKQELRELEVRLNSHQPPEKKITKLTIKKAVWEVGDVLLYQIHNGELKGNEDVKKSKWYNKYVLLRVVGITKTNIGSLPRKYSHEQNVVKIYNWVGEKEPNLEILNKLSFIVTENLYKRLEEAMFILSFNNTKLKKLNFKTIQKHYNYKDVSEHIMSIVGISWENINTIDFAFIQALDAAEREGILIDETNSSI